MKSFALIAVRTRENGRDFDNRYIMLITFNDVGLISRWREYYDAGAVVRAFRER